MQVTDVLADVQSLTLTSHLVNRIEKLDWKAVQTDSESTLSVMLSLPQNVLLTAMRRLLNPVYYASPLPQEEIL